MRGNKHTFLRGNIDINGSTIKVYMVKQLEDFIDIFGEDVSTSFTYPATKKLFKVREYSKQLNDKKGEFFH